MSAWWHAWPDGWRPEMRTVGLLVFILFAMVGIGGLIYSVDALSIAISGHPPGLTQAQSAILSLIPVNVRVADGLAFLSALLSLVIAIGGLAQLGGESWAAKLVAWAAGALATARLVQLALFPFDLRNAISGALTIVALVVLIAVVTGSGIDRARWRRLRAAAAKLYGVGEEASGADTD